MEEFILETEPIIPKKRHPMINIILFGILIIFIVIPIYIINIISFVVIYKSWDIICDSHILRLQIWLLISALVTCIFISIKIFLISIMIYANYTKKRLLFNYFMTIFIFLNLTHLIIIIPSLFFGSIIVFFANNCQGSLHELWIISFVMWILLFVLMIIDICVDMCLRQYE